MLVKKADALTRLRQDHEEMTGSSLGKVVIKGGLSHRRIRGTAIQGSAIFTTRQYHQVAEHSYRS